MLVTLILGALTLLSVGLLFWQFTAARRFPLHLRVTDTSFRPAVTILKPLKGSNQHTAECLRSWLTQEYAGKIQLLFGVAGANDPVCEVVRELLSGSPNVDAELIIAHETLGPNAKVSTLVQLARRAKHDLICISDADVRVPEDFLANAVAPLRDTGVGLMNYFYQLANPTTLAMKWEAIAVNADFWSQVLQSNTIKPQNFALGAAMITRRETLAKIGGFESLLEYLADDYELGHRITATGARITLSPVVVECWDKPMNFAEVWKHQLRWARTIRACQPAPYFFSVLSNVTLWALLFAAFGDLGLLFQISNTAWIAVGFIALRCLVAASLQVRLTQGRDIPGYWWLVPVKDVLQFGIWIAAFAGNTVEWGGTRFRIKRGGRLVPL